jgi:hypothetical protein
VRSSSGAELIKTEDEVITGIMLGHNFCSEHEWGIKGLRYICGGLTDEEADAARIADFSRIVVKIPAECIYFHEAEDLVILGVENDNWLMQNCKNWTDEEFEEHKCTREMSPAEIWATCSYELDIPKKPKKDERYPMPQTVSAWDDSSFGIVSREPEVMTFLKELHEALLKGDGVLYISSTNNSFKPVSGLIVAINSKIPQAQKDRFKSAHEDRFKLMDASDATGIVKKLAKAEKRYMALSPRWCSDNDKLRTKYDVIYWLNPYDQHIVNYGWFTVEELEQWISKTGPVLKK